MPTLSEGDEDEGRPWRESALRESTPKSRPSESRPSNEQAKHRLPIITRSPERKGLCGWLTVTQLVEDGVTDGHLWDYCDPDGRYYSLRGNSVLSS
ncbi:hypothetical protein L1987_09067 [Smallanthus sonchifolius]|uniref:Uncharacterized protein n=1 Tax=Smallanthus sonchifolius TaxID=185202 RepID=A0ACB9JLY7_9ASTR|nr:hypothetical protein L1987_09067 [Smallanthus sonchifolius]